MKKTFKNYKGITLIALIITIVILIILAGVLINVIVGKNGIINRSKEASLLYKKAKYYEEIKLEIAEEQTDRMTNPKNEAFILSLNKRFVGTKQASANEENKAYPGKSWVVTTLMCDSEMNENVNAYENNLLIVLTEDGYEIYIDVDNGSIYASIREDSFKKVEEECVITYEANKGNGSVESQTKRKGFKIKLQDNRFSREYYTFVGWCKDEDGSTTIYAEGSEIRVEEDTILYAIWSKNSVKVSFDANGGEGTMDDIDVIINVPTQLSSNEFIAQEDYKFEKWTTNKDGSGDSYLDRDNITVSENTTLYAQWTDAIAPTINIEVDGSSGLLKIVADVTIEDNNSDLSLTNCKYFISQDNTLNNDKSLYTQSLGSATAKIDVSASTGNWYIHVLATDGSGNEAEAVTEEAIEVSTVKDYSQLIIDSTTQIQSVSLAPGRYKFECWGSSGYFANQSNAKGGLGAYTKGEITLTTGRTFYLYVAGNAEAADIRLVKGEWTNFDSLKSRIMVAGAGGNGNSYWSASSGGAAGGLTAYNGVKACGSSGSTPTGATQTSGGANGLGSNVSDKTAYGGFGVRTGASGSVAAGGNGYYCGGCAPHGSGTVGSGAGGSSYISGHDGCKAITAGSTSSSISHSNSSVHNSGISFTSTEMVDGQGYTWTTQKANTPGTMPNYEGGTMTGNANKGHIRITYLGN